MDSFPWSPLYSIERSGTTEVAVAGIICAVDSAGTPIIETGNVEYILWTRSCLKAWQLLSHLPVLKSAYPTLQPAHFALMLSSHSGEDLHIKYLDEITKISGVEQSLLQCPAVFPMAQADRIHVKDKGGKPSSSYNNCSGKHMGYLLAMKAQNMQSTDYLNPSGKQHEALKQLLAYLLQKDSELPVTIDGCRLPNYAFSISDLAKLYARLVNDLPADQVANAPVNLRPMLAMWSELRQYMHNYPEVVGGKGRLDTRIMQGELHGDSSLKLLAKQGADGLLSISISPCSKFPKGVGLVIKLASGTDMHHMETIVKELFCQLGIREADKPDPKNAHLHNRYYFSSKALTCKTTS